jgi:hypothetical protein
MMGMTIVMTADLLLVKLSLSTIEIQIHLEKVNECLLVETISMNQHLEKIETMETLTLEMVAVALDRLNLLTPEQIL